MPKIFHSSGCLLSGLFMLVLLVSGKVQAGPYSALVVDVESERVLYAQNPDELRYPASLTKMMTLYLVFEALARGQLSLTDTMKASAFAVSKPPSRLGLKAGDTLTVEEGILGLVTQSANDAATVIAETLGGSEPEFAEMMTRKARQLGMANTVFRNAQGLPNPAQVTTARDMYRLAKALLAQFPQYYPYFSTESFWFNGRSFRNHNHLLNRYPGADGIKTGFINASGFNLVASAKRNGSRLIGVVFGGPSHSRRDAHMQEILDDGFAQLEGREPGYPIAGFDSQDTRALAHRTSEFEDPLAAAPPPQLRSARSSPPSGITFQTLETETVLKPSKPRPASISAKAVKKLVEAPGEKPAKPELKPELKKANWEVQVGGFAEAKAAEQRLSEATRSAPDAFRNAKGAVMSHTFQGKKTYIAYFRGLNKEGAALACQFLRRKKLECSPSPG